MSQVIFASFALLAEMVHAEREGSVKGACLVARRSEPLTGSSHSAYSQRKAKELPPDV
jgi:hypothetical protein